MKKFCLVVSLLALLLTLCGCGNKAYGPGNYDFNKIHLDTTNSSRCVNITKWYDNDRGIEVKLESGEGMFCSEGTYILIEDHCPICG